MTKRKLILNCIRGIYIVLRGAVKGIPFVLKHEYLHYKMQNKLMNVAKDLEINDAMARDYQSIVGE